MFQRKITRKYGVNSYRNKDSQCKPIQDSKFNLSTYFSTLHCSIYPNMLQSRRLWTAVQSPTNSSPQPSELGRFYVILKKPLSIIFIAGLRQKKSLCLILKKPLSVSENLLRDFFPSRPTPTPAQAYARFCVALHKLPSWPRQNLVLGKTRTAVSYRKKKFRPFRSQVSVVACN